MSCESYFVVWIELLRAQLFHSFMTDLCQDININGALSSRKCSIHLYKCMHYSTNLRIELSFQILDIYSADILDGRGSSFIMVLVQPFIWFFIYMYKKLMAGRHFQTLKFFLWKKACFFNVWKKNHTHDDTYWTFLARIMWKWNWTLEL